MSLISTMVTLLIKQIEEEMKERSVIKTNALAQ